MTRLCASAERAGPAAVPSEQFPEFFVAGDTGTSKLHADIHAAFGIG
jgi:hypothetical protein